MAETKDSLLKYFASLDVNILNRLKKYASLLIIPDEDLLTNATMSQMVDKAHKLADSLFPEWTDRSKSDFGEFLVELFALYSEKDFWYINAFANEGIFRKMRSYSNAFSKASTLGYVPTLCKGAEGTFSVTFQEGEASRYLRGDLVIVVDDIEYSNDEEFIVENSADLIVKQLVLKEGVQVAEDFTFNGHCIFVRRPNVDIQSLSVKIDNINYTRVGNFGESDNTSYHYMALPEADGSCSIFFGSDGFGVTPEVGKVVHLEYRLCNGSKGNQDITKAKVNDSLSERPALSVVMSSSATGGTDAESLTSIKEKAPTYFINRKTAINEKTSEEIISSYPFVHQSKVYADRNDVFYQVIPLSGSLEPSLEERRYIEEHFDEVLLLGYTSHYVPNTYINLIGAANPSATKLLIDVIALTGYPLGPIEDGVKQVMEDITNPLSLAAYGKGFFKVDTDILMRSRISGIQSVSFKYLTGTEEHVMPDIPLGENTIFKKINVENIEVRINVI